ncbi:hypothetical protein [Streptomyces sp. NPDC003327]
MMNNARIGTALVGGYLLGRTKKAKLAVGLAMMLAGSRVKPAQLARSLANSPLLSNVNEQVRGELTNAGKAAATTVINAKAEHLADALHQRTMGLRESGQQDAEQDARGEDRREDTDDGRERDEDRDEDRREDTDDGRDTGADADEESGSEKPEAEAPRPKPAPKKSETSAKRRTSSRSTSSAGSAGSAGSKSARGSRSSRRPDDD